MLLGILSLWQGEGTPPPTTPTLRPGRVYKSDYPYWKPIRKPYWEIEQIEVDETFLEMLGIEL